jgi:phosphonate transport system ATP-binding protein
LGKPTALLTGPAATPDASGELPLAIRGLHKAFGSRVALDEVDLAVRQGELVVVLGANGSGKSTTLRCVVGLLEPDAGSIRINGQEVVGLRGASLAAARRDVAMIFQQIHLIRRRSVVDNVSCGALGRLPLRRSFTPALFPRHVREHAMQCLHRVGLSHRASERVAALSGGQQQRVAIARALCQGASVLLADEPVAALDPAAAEQVMSLLRALAHDEGLAVVAVLHQPDLARRHADRVVGLLRGRPVFDRDADHLDPDEVDALYVDERGVA